MKNWKPPAGAVKHLPGRHVSIPQIFSQKGPLDLELLDIIARINKVRLYLIKIYDSESILRFKISFLHLKIWLIWDQFKSFVHRQMFFLNFIKSSIENNLRVQSRALAVFEK